MTNSEKYKQAARPLPTWCDKSLCWVGELSVKGGGLANVTGSGSRGVLI